MKSDYFVLVMVYELFHLDIMLNNINKTPTLSTVQKDKGLKLKFSYTVKNKS